jgi:bis(5'-nucleosyl)-tetraphosphatase (symmetrical)
MATYAIGDLQGCFDAFEGLLNKLDYNSNKDQLWLAGDLVNRGSQSLSCLRKAKALNATIVLGNHDLHMLACYYGSEHSLKKNDTLGEVFDAEDCATLMAWLKAQPLLHYDKSRHTLMSHAGVPHIWSIKQALGFAKEVNEVLAGSNARDYFDQMYGNEPSSWNESLVGVERLRVITNYFTRMRFIRKDGALEFAAKENVDAGPKGFAPWFDYSPPHDAQIVFGHWAAINGETNKAQFKALDTGCVWGGCLTALNLDNGQRTHYNCEK